jgi:GTP-binding protein
MTVAGATRNSPAGASTDERPAVPARTVAFTVGASRPGNLPPLRRPEIALAGRSNVGKSSLLNRLVQRSGMARVSKTPGRTQQINFFLIDDEWSLVDLPGYGFARVPLHVRESWQDLVEAFLLRATLRGVVVIVDLRRGIQADDAALLDFLARSGVRSCIAATKADKVPRGRRQQQIGAVQQARPEAELVVCSAATGEGVADLAARMRRWLGARA